jgi:murein DD-endopeptidase MepM/ murein hydrolase activator NlpD
MSQVLAEIQGIDQQIMDASEALEAIELDLLTTQVRIEDAQYDLVLATEERDAQMEILRERVRGMHEQGATGFIEILFNAESIYDFFSRLEYVRMVTQFDRDLLARLDAAEERRTSNLDTLTADYALVQDLQSEIILAREEFEQRMDERRIFWTLLYADAERYAEFLRIQEEEARLINLEFGIVQTRYRAEVAEAERIRREQEEARRAAEAAVRAAESAARMAELEAQGITVGAFTWPVPARPHTNPANISSPFGNRADPFTGRTAFHSGVAIPAPAGTHILAAQAGYVRIAAHSPSWGNYVVIDHPGGYSTLYAHNSRNRVTVGQRVTAGQHIADVGTTGRSTGNHLHFEIRLNGTHVNPMRYFGG